MTRQVAIANPKSRLVEPIPATRNLAVRKSVYDLEDDEQAALRGAFAQIQAIADNRGYAYLAGLHGLPSYYCPHGTLDFLIWHRPYVLLFEQALQGVSPGMGLPYWDWTSARAQGEGIPALFADAAYTDATGKVVSNPLYQAAILYSNPDNLTATTRDGNPLDGLVALADVVARANREETYDRFCPATENAHNGLHGWVGGTMGDVSYAAFDPVFWAHHCFIEKLFCDWQDRNPVVVPASIHGHVMAPFTKTADDLWDYKQLGYRYQSDGTKRQVSPLAALLASATPTAPESQVATFDLAHVPKDFVRARLRFAGTRHPLASLEVRVFFAQKPVTVTDPNPKDAALAAKFFTFGHQACTGSAGHCDPPALPEDATRFATLRPLHHLSPMRLEADVTEALRAAKASGAQVDVHVVGVDHKGRFVPGPPLEFDTVTLDAV